MDDPRQNGPRAKIHALSVAVSSGFLSVLVTSFLDTYQAFFEVSGAGAKALLALQIIGRLAPAGLALALIAWTLCALGAALGRRLGKKGPGFSALLQTLGAAPGLVYVSLRLFQGGVTSQLPGRPFLIAAVAAILCAAFFAGARVTARVLDKLDSAKGLLNPWRIGLVVLLVVGGLGLRWCDAHMYRRLYLYLHVLLGVGTLGFFALAFRVVLFRLASRRIVPAAVSAIALTGIAFAASIITSESKQTVKVAVYERTTTTANVLLVTSGPRKVGTGKRPSEETRRHRYERERKARLAASQGDFPAFPGAHVILITVDALRADRMGVYGYEERDTTPHLDDWAKSAVVFDRAYCAAPHSSYSITSLHTSRYTHDEAMLGVDIAHPSMADILTDNDYDTSGFYTQGIFFTEGDNVAHYKRTEFGFSNVGHGAPRPERLTDLAIAEMDRAVAKGEPAFFLWAHYFNVHEPYRSTRFGTSPRERYEGEIVDADKAVARLIAYAEEKLARDTVFIFSADHGEEFKDHGGHYHGSTLYEEQIRVPLIVKAPGAKPGRINAPVSLVDVLPTALEIVGIPKPAHLMGQDLRPAIFGGSDAHVAKPVFSSVMRRHMVVQWPWKLISDPSRGLFELYNLMDDPFERTNRYDDNKELADNLLQETYAWLDDISRGDDAAKTAINLGRMRDKRSIPGLMSVARNTGAPLEDRTEALRLLAEIKAWKQVRDLEALLDDHADEVALAAALALAAIDNDSGAEHLRQALFDDDPDVRDSAAMALGKLGDKEAVPVLIQALGRNNLKTRENAIRLLGNLRDPDATEPLIETISEDRTRYLTVLALGKIGDPRAYDTLMDVLKYETHTDIRGYAVVSLGWMQAQDAVERIVRVLEEEPELKWSTECLVRLGAIEKGYLLGTDVAKGLSSLSKGWGKCTEKERVIPGKFMGRTTCTTKGRKGILKIEGDAADGGTLYFRGRHTDTDPGAAHSLVVRIDGKEIGRLNLTGKMEEHQLELAPGILVGKSVTVEIELETTQKVRVEADHLLINPA